MRGLIVALLGAVGSVALMLRVGRHNSSMLLNAIFTGWVLSPYAVLIWAYVKSRSWASLTRVTLDAVTIVIALTSLIVYGVVAFGPPRAKSASAFVILPPVSWVLIAIALPIAARIGGRKHQGTSVPLGPKM